MGPEQQEDDRANTEVVFVLRVRAKGTGWWGQVKRLDNGSLRYIAGQPQLHALLDHDWELEITHGSGAGQIEHDHSTRHQQSEGAEEDTP